MKTARLCLLVAACLCLACDLFAQTKQPTIVLNGGNGMGLEISKPVLEMAGGSRAIVVVVVHERGPGDMALSDWRQAQPANVIPVNLTDVAASRDVFNRATLIWFAGGFTQTLMDGIRDTYLPAYIRERWMNGVVVGGDSAGAMIFPRDIFISGPSDLTSIVAGQKTIAGLGLTAGVLVDAHFVKRQRLNRLVSLVLDHPDRIGIGADEGTAVVIRGRTLSVLGASNVVVLDPRKSKVAHVTDGQRSSGRDLKMQVLTHGMTFDLGDAAPTP